MEREVPVGMAEMVANAVKLFGFVHVHVGLDAEMSDQLESLEQSAAGSAIPKVTLLEWWGYQVMAMDLLSLEVSALCVECTCMSTCVCVVFVCV